MLGSNNIKSSSKSQAVIALSSGEAEYYGLGGVLSQAMGEKATAADWNIKLEIEAVMDATAAIAIGSRKGLGRVKHIDTMYLWCQDCIREKKASLTKVPTDKMVADFLTKVGTAAKLLWCLAAMNFEYCTGRHSKAKMLDF